MKALYVILIAAAVVALRSRDHEEPPAARTDAAQNADGSDAAPPSGRVRRRAPTPPNGSVQPPSQSFGDVGMVAMREIRERVRGRIFRIGTLIILLFVGAAIVIPTLHKGSGHDLPDRRDRG